MQETLEEKIFYRDTIIKINIRMIKIIQLHLPLLFNREGAPREARKNSVCRHHFLALGGVGVD